MKTFLFPRPEDRPLFKSVLDYAKKKKIKLYIVGGYLRDFFLGKEKENPDIDFSLPRGAIDFGRQLAREIGAGFVVLDQEHGACRLVKKLKSKTCTLDFTDFRGRNLEGDLLHRDFTINSLCLELEKVFSGDKLNASVIDLYGAKRDLKAKTIRMVGETSFVEDPLRILRCFSFASILGFRIEKGTLGSVKVNKGRLVQVSSERIRDEIFKILDRPQAHFYLTWLDKLKILKIIFPEIEMMRNLRQGPYHHLDIWKHTLETLKQLEIIFDEQKKNLGIEQYLNEVISAERKRRALMKLGALLHDIGKPKALRREGRKIKFHGHERTGLDFTQTIAERLKLSNDELDSLKKMVLWHLRPGYLADSENPTPRAIFRYFRDTAREALSVLLISLADQRATKGRLTTKDSREQHERVVSRLIKIYFKKSKEVKLPRLINGNDLMKQFKLEPSILIGKILSEVEELQAIGKIKSKKEALESAKKIVSRLSPKAPPVNLK